jgi:cilia- and flagella-associated protein 65
MSLTRGGSVSPTLTMMSDNPLAISRGERGRKFGIDCVNALTWSAGAWEPGGEFVKKLIVKNVSTQTVKIKYQIPATKFFSMEFPKMMILSPGMFVAVDVLFRPIRYEPYDDVILFRTVAGEFGVRVQSFISTLKVAIPPTLDLGFCPTGEVTTRTIKVRNIGQQTATFSWKHGPPFVLSPLTGTVKPGQSCNIQVSFDPTDATVFVASAVCNIPGHDPLLMKISGIGKYPFISSSDRILDFEEVLTDIPSRYVQKEFELRNQSLVRATFKIVAVEHDHDPVFRFSPTIGCIDPESHIMVKVQYHPKSARSFTCDNFDIVTPGGNTVRMNCRALGMGPQVVLAKKEVPKEEPDEDDVRPRK